MLLHKQSIPLYKAVPIPDSGSPQQQWQTLAPVCFCLLHSKDKDKDKDEAVPITVVASSTGSPSPQFAFVFYILKTKTKTNTKQCRSQTAVVPASTAFAPVCFCLLHSDPAMVECPQYILVSTEGLLEMDDTVAGDEDVPDSEEVKDAEERVTEADIESTTADETKCDDRDLSVDLQEQLTRLACLNPLAVTYHMLKLKKKKDLVEKVGTGYSREGHRGDLSLTTSKEVSLTRGSWSVVVVSDHYQRDEINNWSVVVATNWPP